MNQFTPIGIVQILICLAVVAMSSVITISFSIFVPDFIKALNTNVGTLSMAISIVLFVVGIASPIVGRLLDLWSVRRLLTIGGTFMILGFVGASLSQTATHLLFSYFLLGLGYSAFAPLVVVKHMSVWFPDRLGLATSLITLPIGIVVFPPATQWLITTLDWRQTMLIYSAITAVILLMFFFLKPSPMVEYAKNDNEQTPNNDIARPSSMVIYKTLLTSKLFWFGILGFCVFMAGPISIMTHFIVLAQTKGLTTETAVGILSIMGISALIGAPVFGFICDRYGPRFGYILSAVFQGGALLQLTGNPSEMLITLATVVIGLFLPSSYVFFTAFVSKVIGAKYFGTGFGLATLIAAVVGAFPPAIAGNIFDRTNSYDVFFMPLGILTLSVGLIAWFLDKPNEVQYSEN